jgi:hypothetical protein
MTLSQIKEILSTLEVVQFELEDGKKVPAHFHVTEVGLITKDFIDCGGVVRQEKRVNFQLWSSIDLHHRLKPQKLLNIIALSERKLNLPDAEIEVEYQGETVGKYDLDISEGKFILKAKQTDCLAQDQCGIPTIKVRKNLSELSNHTNSCTPGGGCC